MNTKIVIVVLLVILALGAWFFIGSGPKAPDYGISEGEAQEKVEAHIKTNISTLSPEKEVLGGKFYVTEIVWDTETSGVVSYEDGHIALRASFDATVNNDGAVNITEFTLLPR